MFIQDYLRADDIGDLCERIHMPGEVIEATLEAVRTCDYSGMDDAFASIFSLETGDAAMRAFREKYRDDDHSLKALAVYLAAALHTREIYRERGISLDIFYATVGAFSRFVKEHKESFGFYGFDRDSWMYRCLSAHLFRVGVLEYELYVCPPDTSVGDYAGPGDPLISVHIPSDSVITRAALDESYAAARAFLAQIFPDFHYKCAFTNTWLLSPALRDLLRESSRILDFQRDYEVVRYDDQAGGAMKWLFKRQYEDLHELPENTSLQRDAKRYMLAGGKIGNAVGVLKRWL